MYHILLLILILGQSYAQTSFSYSEQLLWPDQFPQCAGKRQSPIEICSRNAISTFTPRFRFSLYSRALPTPLFIQSKSDTVDVSIPNASLAQLPTVRGGPIKEKFQFEALHFHWGDRDNRGSEHVINGKQYPLELHIIHRNTKYDTLTEALECRDGFMVFGILFEISKSDNPVLSPMVDVISSGNLTSTSPVNLDARISLKSFLSGINVDKYFTYSGSLTIPTCNEAVTWVVFSETAKISSRQLKVFRNFVGSSGEVVRSNYRFSQRLNCRKVYRSIGIRKNKNK